MDICKHIRPPRKPPYTLCLFLTHEQAAKLIDSSLQTSTPTPSLTHNHRRFTDLHINVSRVSSAPHLRQKLLLRGERFLFFFALLNRNLRNGTFGPIMRTLPLRHRKHDKNEDTLMTCLLYLTFPCPERARGKTLKFLTLYPKIGIEATRQASTLYLPPCRYMVAT